jgi:hypothetical protein
MYMHKGLDSLPRPTQVIVTGPPLHGLELNTAPSLPDNPTPAEVAAAAALATASQQGQQSQQGRLLAVDPGTGWSFAINNPGKTSIPHRAIRSTAVPQVIRRIYVGCTTWDITGYVTQP